MQSFISTVSLDAFSDKNYLNYSLSEIDKRYFFIKIKRLSRMHAHEYYDPNIVKR